MHSPLLLIQNHISYDEPLLSEAGTFQLEFAYLARVTEDDSFMIPVNHVNSIVRAPMSRTNLLPAKHRHVLCIIYL
jgi:hypothetical protein